MKNKTQLLLLIPEILLAPLLSAGQNVHTSNRGDRKMQMHHEMPDGDYLPNPYNNKKTSPAYKYKNNGRESRALWMSSSIFTTQVNVDANGQNILGDAANEPNIAINPLNPNNIVIGWRQFDNVQSNFRQAGWSYSSNGGQTWTFPGVIQRGIFRSDPVLDYDAFGNFYYNSLTHDPNTGTFSCTVFKSTDGGVTWNSGTNAWGGDKQWMTIDRTNGVGSGNIYSFWTSYYSSCQPNNFTRSTDGGASFENCTFVTGDPYWGTMAVGNNGELYVAGAGPVDSMVVAKSTNAKIPNSSVTWDTAVYVFLDGYLNYGVTINHGGLIGQLNIDVDRSNGPGSGNVYLVASVTRVSNSDSADVMFVKSTDGGLTWSAPVKINDDISTDNRQWLATMSVAPNGRIDVVWLDTRDAPPGLDSSALYYSYSLDQGNTWSPNERLSPLFDPHIGYPQQNKMGDYFDMISDNSGAHLAWANTLNGEEDVYYSYITPGITAVENIGGTDQNYSLTVSPNPFISQTTIRYQIPDTRFVKLVISNIYGQEITTLVNKKQTAGTYNVTFSADMLNPGYYFCRLIAGSHTETTRLIVIK
jgi:hypothetical protein